MQVRPGQTMIMVMTNIKPVLEKAAQDFADATKNPPFLYDLGPIDGRKTVDSVQDGEGVPLPDADLEDLKITDGVSIRIFRPAGSTGPLPVLLYTHGAGW